MISLCFPYYGYYYSCFYILLFIFSLSFPNILFFIYTYYPWSVFFLSFQTALIILVPIVLVSKQVPLLWILLFLLFNIPNTHIHYNKSIFISYTYNKMFNKQILFPNIQCNKINNIHKSEAQEIRWIKHTLKNIEYCTFLYWESLELLSFLGGTKLLKE